MHVFERVVGGRKYRVAAESVWDPTRGRSVSRQRILGLAEAPPKVGLGRHVTERVSVSLGPAGVAVAGRF